MSNTTLELTDTSGNDILTNKNPTNSLSDDSEYESIESNIINKENTSSKLRLFIKNYIKQFILVFQSIIPDLKSFKWWQLIILIIYATFNAIFSILVNIYLIFIYF
jgi:hypothetical protein